MLGAALGWAGYWWTTLRFIETTDNAYVQAPLVQITPLVDGTVVEVLVDDTDRVAAGQPLVRLDPTDARLALERSQAALAQAVREVRVLRAQDGSLDAQSKLKRAEVERHRAEVARAEDDVARRRALVDSGAVSDEDMKHADATLAAARSTLAAARSAQSVAEQQALGNLALSDGTRIDGHPNVLRAAAALREAWLALRRSELRAPLAGQVARRTVQVGQHVAAGAVLMSVIPLDKVWVEANFKEAQLRRMRIGQPVTLRCRCLRLPGRVPRPHRWHRRRYRRGLCAAAGAERHRQLDQGGAACAGAHRAERRTVGRASVARRPVDAGHRVPGRRRARGRACAGRLGRVR